MAKKLPALRTESIGATPQTPRVSAASGEADGWLVDAPTGRTLTSERSWLDWRLMTTVPDKIKYYGSESYFRESLADARFILGADAIRLLQSVTALVFKPDAIVGRRIPLALAFLRRHHFTPLLGTSFRYGRLHLREDWRFQLNQLTLDRMRLNTLLAGMSPSFMLFLRDDTPASERRLPASVRLQMLKGPSRPEQQTAEHLRFVMKSWSRLLKFIHAPDEPADLVREMGILFAEDERRALYAAIVQAVDRPNVAGVEGAIQALHDTFPAHELAKDISIARLAADLRVKSADNPALDCIYRRFERTRAACAQGRFLAWMPFERELAAAGMPITWDHLVFAAATIHHSFDDEVALVPSDGTEGWLCGRGLLI
ncbi:hypothetical protein PMI42_03101 [Bradyrhizobium sp. YR681]|uniref:hypothetical protein n=1 Tax=Bradyrhizobium sp. YR681 TaxID=1144344 RepID=UPI0002711BB2|nr:hypothetical protein [Bradyrhizobium sp. YR681]EJN13528.1 hypothetical protein PMI42_03101 [Bradyrhizobium sp. YR681]